MPKKSLAAIFRAFRPEPLHVRRARPKTNASSMSCNGPKAGRAPTLWGRRRCLRSSCLIGRGNASSAPRAFRSKLLGCVRAHWSRRGHDPGMSGAGTSMRSARPAPATRPGCSRSSPKTAAGEDDELADTRDKSGNRNAVTLNQIIHTMSRDSVA